MIEEKQCKWGREIKASFVAQPTPDLPEGWLRVFEDHWDCSPAILYYAPGVRPDHPSRADKPWLGDATIALHVDHIEWGRYTTLVGAPELARMIAIVKADHAWMVDFEREHGLNCTHGEEEDAAAQVDP